MGRCFHPKSGNYSTLINSGGITNEMIIIKNILEVILWFAFVFSIFKYYSILEKIRSHMLEKTKKDEWDLMSFYLVGASSPPCFFNLLFREKNKPNEILLGIIKCKRTMAISITLLISMIIIRHI
ncbi:hypothetical protein HZU77_014770 [Neisseriaceae bacterium TC5R-5]|nr:hypothetical protein [Neisseriaceae bacterium TC5R-5]